jgi:hypothetical protein
MGSKKSLVSPSSNKTAATVNQRASTFALACPNEKIRADIKIKILNIDSLLI